MIKIENTDVYGWEAAIRGMRNPMNSWDKSDSDYRPILCNRCDNCMSYQFERWDDCNECEVEKLTASNKGFMVGPNDLKLMKSLSKAGPDHGKFLRMINVTCDITAPQFWIAEFDTYKIATVRNSCSLQHKGSSRDFTIRDFTVPEELYDILDPIRKSLNHHLVYEEVPDNSYKVYKCGDREYKIYPNGKIIACAFTRTDTIGNRTKHFLEKEVKPSQTTNGYFEVNLGGRVCHEKWLVHRLIAELFIDRADIKNPEVNHKDGNKGNNNVSNLEWVTHQENEIHKHKNGLSGRTLHTDYIAYKNGLKFTLDDRQEIIKLYNTGNYTQNDLSRMFNIQQPQISAILNNYNNPSRKTELFELAMYWERLIEQINTLRRLYVETQDYDYFLAMRQLLPMGYNYRFTVQLNYQVLKSMYFARRNHKLDEWRNFCAWCETLPYFKEICIQEGDSNE